MAENASRPSDLDGLSDALKESCRRSTSAAGRVSVLFSGGLDSSLLAWALRERTPTLVTVGAPGSVDLEAAEEGARLLGLPWVPFEVERTDVAEFLASEQMVVRELHEPARSVFVTTGLALRRVRDPVAVMGQGADELFLGYAHYRGLDPEEARRVSSEDLARLLDADWPRARELARSLEIDLVAPFLDPKVVAWARDHPGDLRAREGEPTKLVLRFLAEAWGVPEALRSRPKKAMQYGSGVARIVRELDRASGPSPVNDPE